VFLDVVHMDDFNGGQTILELINAAL